MLARFNFVADQLHLVPLEQVGFWEDRAVEDNIGRLVQEVQVCWNRSRSRPNNAPDGTCSQRYALVAFDFSRAYDTVVHRLLRARLQDQLLPRCFVQGTWQLLRDRRATVDDCPLSTPFHAVMRRRACCRCLCVGQSSPPDSWLRHALCRRATRSERWRTWTQVRDGLTQGRRSLASRRRGPAGRAAAPGPAAAT